MGVEESDALVADGSCPHGNWFTKEEDVYTIFMTMHMQDDDGFREGFEDRTYSQAYMIFDALCGDDESWSPAALTQFIEHPVLLGQVLFKRIYINAFRATTFL